MPLFIAIFIAIGEGRIEAQAAEVPPFANTEASEDGQWLMPAKDYANTRFNGLKEKSSATSTLAKR